MPFRNYCGRSLAKLEARDEAKKQKTLENRDKGMEISQMEAVILDMDSIIIFCLARMELRRDT